MHTVLNVQLNFSYNAPVMHGCGFLSHLVEKVPIFVAISIEAGLDYVLQVRTNGLFISFMAIYVGFDIVENGLWGRL